MNNDNTIGGGCQTLTLIVNTSNSGYVYILTLLTPLLTRLIIVSMGVVYAIITETSDMTLIYHVIVNGMHAGAGPLPWLCQPIL